MSQIDIVAKSQALTIIIVFGKILSTEMNEIQTLFEFEKELQRWQLTLSVLQKDILVCISLTWFHFKLAVLLMLLSFHLFHALQFLVWLT